MASYAGVGEACRAEAEANSEEAVEAAGYWLQQRYRVGPVCRSSPRISAYRAGFAHPAWLWPLPSPPRSSPSRQSSCQGRRWAWAAAVEHCRGAEEAEGKEADTHIPTLFLIGAPSAKLQLKELRPGLRPPSSRILSSSLKR